MLLNLVMEGNPFPPIKEDLIDYRRHAAKHFVMPHMKDVLNIYEYTIHVYLKQIMKNTYFIHKRELK